MSTDMFDGETLDGADYDIGLDLEECDVPIIGRRDEPRVQPAEPEDIADEPAIEPEVIELPDPPDPEPDQAVDGLLVHSPPTEPAEDDWLAIAARDLPTEPVAPPKNGHRSADRPDGATWRADSDGWHRYRGLRAGLRGRMTDRQSDSSDLTFVLGEIRAAAPLLDRAHELRDARDPDLRRECRESMRHGLARLAMASRAIDELVEKRGGITGDCQ